MPQTLSAHAPKICLLVIIFIGLLLVYNITASSEGTYTEALELPGQFFDTIKHTRQTQSETSLPSMKPIFLKILARLAPYFHRLSVLYWRTFKPRTFGSRVLLRSETMVLLVRHIGGKLWMLPGGGRKHGENPENCAMREIREELAIHLDANALRLFGIYTNRLEGKRDTIHLYVADVEKENMRLQWEVEEALWFPATALPEGASQATRERIEEMLAGKPNPEGLWVSKTPKRSSAY